MWYSQTDKSVERNCPICQTVFFAGLRNPNQKYCSDPCRHVGMRKDVTRICPTCGKDFVTKPSLKKLHCSPQCWYNRTGRPPKNYSWTNYTKIYVVGVGKKWEHRYVMEQHLGRKLESWEQVHHLNGKKKDNRIENLHLVTPSEHSIYTTMEKKIRSLEKQLKILKQKYELVLTNR